MPPDKLFIRDKRETPFLHSQVVEILKLADTASSSVSIREDDDFGFMTIQFLYKQMQHGESILLLVPRRDAGLIARTMIEGLYQLLWVYHAREERAKLWRSFSIVHDCRLIQGRLKEGLHVDEADIRRNEAGLQEFGHLHRTKKPKPSDPYHKNWRGGVSLSDMADIVGRELYDGAYADLSDWEHWGVSGIGEAISRERNSVLVAYDSDRIAGLSFLVAFQCLLQTLEVADLHLSLNIAETLNTISTNFKATIDSFYQ